MDIYIHIEKKHLYALIAVLTLAFGTLYVVAAGYSGFRNPVTGISHHLQDVVKNDAKTSVDLDNNGVIDASDACNGLDKCTMNTTKFTPQNPGAPVLGQIWIKT